ncbi:ATP-binding protein [Nonomuraea sp. NPDC050404]|uniref:ATP-binding protein n=1 Tax=Nonomuraea sp. NPDC050404 TaxID=3155783 RepID=UPI0033E00399
MLDEELSEIVENLRTLGGDVADVEVKKSQRELPKTIRESLSAFANTHGGVLILGLDESAGFAATGVQNAVKISNDLASLCSTDMEPVLRPLIRVHDFEGVQVIVAEVPELERARRPCFYKGAGMTKGSFIRVGDGDRHLSSYEVQIMLSSRGQPRDDEQGIPGAGLELLDPVALETFVQRLRISRPYAFRDCDRDALLRRAKIMVTGHDGAEVLSLAALLALGTYPQEHFPQLIISFVHFPSPTGDDAAAGTRFLDNLTIEGPIPVMVRDALAVIRRNMSKRAIVGGAGREDVWEYPETALREVVANALVHRDLSSTARGAQIQLEMYPDRLVVRSPGGLFGPVTVDNLADDGISSTRNATLMRILEDVVLPGETRTVCENRGSGIRAMVNALRSAGMSPPQFDDRISAFTVTFPNHTLLDEETVRWIEGLGEQRLTDSQCIALAMLREGQILDNRSYRNTAGVDSRVATAELRDLVARELVVQTGTNRWARYELSERLHRRSPQETSLTTRTDRRPQLLDALGDETLSRADLARRTGLTDQTVRRWLAILREEGTVELIGSSPRSKLARYRRARQASLFS